MIRYDYILKLLIVLCVSISNASPTLIAPMIDGLRGCPTAYADPSVTSGSEALGLCRARSESAATLLEDLLAGIGPRKSIDGRFELGYTLTMPLLSYVETDFENRQISIDRGSIRSDLQVLSDANLPVVLYLFGNHFVSGTESGATLQLTHDSESLIRLADGSVPIDRYFQSTIIPWALDNEQSLYDQARRQAIQAVMDEVCLLPAKDRERIRAVTVLGEIHHFYPNFSGGMGYGGPYRITDYGAHSQTRFRLWLKQRFGDIDTLNEILSSHFESFETIEPPQKDVQKEVLNNFFEHIDPHAHGEIPFFGWAYDKAGRNFRILIYLNGKYLADADTGLTRVDVAQAIESLKDSNVGFRYVLDFSALPPGIQEVEIRYLGSGRAATLETYNLVVMDRVQSKPLRMSSYGAPKPSASPPKEFRFWVDYPDRITAVFHNPLARLWLDFRSDQVTREIERYSSLVQESCIDDEKVFSHQIAAGFNGSWSPTLLASDKSLELNKRYALGVNLYGGIVYGSYFFDWLNAKGHTRYGVPEMHPMTASSPELIAEALRRHQANGAVFLSPYFLSIRPPHFAADREHERFRVAPDNQEYDSHHFYRALQQTMSGEE